MVIHTAYLLCTGGLPHFTTTCAHAHRHLRDGPLLHRYAALPATTTAPPGTVDSTRARYLTHHHCTALCCYLPHLTVCTTTVTAPTARLLHYYHAHWLWLSVQPHLPPHLPPHLHYHTPPAAFAHAPRYVRFASYSAVDTGERRWCFLTRLFFPTTATTRSLCLAAP